MSTRIRRLLVVIAASAAALALWALAVPLAGVDLAALQGGSERAVGPVAVAAAGLLTGLAGWALLAVLERFTDKAGRIWTVAAAAVLLLSLLGTLGAVSTAAMLVLMGMHAVVGAVLIPGLARR
ncbi:DUF6069 family protein [Glycomyces sp. A-F 0318]|uniref:DUF6069 family protein n=1 Tax=Glycomyces amatae TaxID=2881355 RepID=UPI001E3E4EBF|nr:DUF6069 family protein [Glycomyces amatae]MCD0447361.1 DUF6069 family protein [Glycomyces amatae]